jgi:hypothetical protein
MEDHRFLQTLFLGIAQGCHGTSSVILNSPPSPFELERQVKL